MSLTEIESEAVENESENGNSIQVQGNSVCAQYKLISESI